jgi:alcohol dehydrogenase class IV
MPIQFSFATASRIIFGKGSVSEVPSLIEPYGRRVFIVMGISIEQVAPLLDKLEIRQIEHALFFVTGEPTVSMVSQAIEKARAFQPQVIIGIGGGSAIDTGKAVAALYTNPGKVTDYLEVIGAGKSLSQKPLPYFAVPTTAGTGSEVTKNAVLLSEEHHVKVSLRHEWMIPAVAVIDPQLTYSLPAKVTAATGMDAITQLIEPFVSLKANLFVDALCRQGLKMGAPSLLKAVRNGSDEQARKAMSFAALCGGLALANAGLGAVHGFAGVIGGMFPAPHGAVCARLLPIVMQANIKALQQRAPDSPALAKYQEIAVLLTGNPEASLQQGSDWLFKLNQQLAIEPLKVYGIKSVDFHMIVNQAQKASSMKSNPIVLTEDELSHVLELAL